MIIKGWQVLAATRDAARQWLLAMGNVPGHAFHGATGDGQTVPLAEHVAKSYFRF